MDYLLKDILKIDALKGASFVGNKEQLEHKVTGITVIDSPDISSWIKGGEIILTSFYPLKGLSPNEMNEWMNELADKGISALIVKIQKVFDEVPDSVLSAAKRRSIPIIKIPKDVAFIDITYPVMEQLFNNQVKKLRYFKEIHSRFTSLSLKNVGGEEIVMTLEELIGNPVAIYSESFQKIVSTNEDVDLFYDIDQRDDSEEYYDYETKFPFYRRPVVFPKLQERECEQIVVPIKTINNTQIFLVISVIQKSVTEYDFIAIENAATALSLDLVKQIAISEVEKKFKNDLVDDLISGKIKSLDTLYDRARITDMDMDGKYAVVLFNLKSLHNNEVKKDERHKQIRKHLEQLSNIINFYLTKPIIRSRIDQIVVLWKVNGKADVEKYEINKIKQTVEHIRSKFKASVEEYAVQVGIGEISPSIMNLSHSYNEAQESLNIGQTYHTNDPDFTLSFSDLGIFRLLYQFDDVNKLKEYIPASLQKLLDYQHSNRAVLIETLNVFLQCHQNIAKSAQLLFVHYKTVTYRLERIKEITGMNYEDSEEMLSVQVGLRIMDIVYRNDQ